VRQDLIEAESNGLNSVNDASSRDVAAISDEPEQRQCNRPTTEQILRLFSLAQRHNLIEGAHTVQILDVEFTHFQRQVLSLLGVPEHAFHSPR